MRRERNEEGGLYTLFYTYIYYNTRRCAFLGKSGRIFIGSQHLVSTAPFLRESRTRLFHSSFGWKRYVRVAKMALSLLSTVKQREREPSLCRRSRTRETLINSYINIYIFLFIYDRRFRRHPRLCLFHTNRHQRQIDPEIYRILYKSALISLCLSPQAQKKQISLIKKNYLMVQPIRNNSFISFSQQVVCRYVCNNTSLNIWQRLSLLNGLCITSCSRRPFTASRVRGFTNV